MKLLSAEHDLPAPSSAGHGCHELNTRQDFVAELKQLGARADALVEIGYLEATQIRQRVADRLSDLEEPLGKVVARQIIPEIRKSLRNLEKRQVRHSERRLKGASQPTESDLVPDDVA